MDPPGRDPLLRSFGRHLYAETTQARTAAIYHKVLKILYGCWRRKRDPSQPDGQVRALLAELMPLLRADGVRAASTSGVKGAALLAELGAALIRQVRAWQPVVVA